LTACSLQPSLSLSLSLSLYVFTQSPLISLYVFKQSPLSLYDHPLSFDHQSSMLSSTALYALMKIRISPRSPRVMRSWLSQKVVSKIPAPCEESASKTGIWSGGRLKHA